MMYWTLNQEHNKILGESGITKTVSLCLQRYQMVIFYKSNTIQIQEISRIGKSIEIESQLVDSSGWGRRKWE